MKRFLKNGGSILLALLLTLLLPLSGLLSPVQAKGNTKDHAIMIDSDSDASSEDTLDPDGSYTSKEDVALYLHLYGELPSNFITKKEAKNKGWDNSLGNLAEVCPGKSIGGDYFGNYEELLPAEDSYHECDIDYKSGYRNAKRIIYSDSGYIYYTEDHYKTFDLLYEP